MFSKCRTDAFRKMSMKCFALSYNIKKEERLLEMHKSNFVENGTNINFRSSVKASEANSTESLKSGFSRTFRLVYNNELTIIAQINLGQFSLLPTPGNGWNLGMSQGANIFGFGGHRALGISGNNGGIGMSGTDNVIIGNERVGLDSGLGIGQGQGLNLGSMLQFGNSPNPMHPSGHMGNFLDNIKNFFASLIPQPAPPPPPPMPLPPRRHRPRPTQQPPGELWENTSEEPDAWAPERMTSRSPLEVVLPSRPHRISTEGGVGPGRAIVLINFKDITPRI
ncbi:hypothetical protein RB195_019209 [Necator americanus]|uniref:Uncharacterized protein n=1 Tax=Necator americanus TaxID=51031 RepID=A0ABR1CD43_NECAM